MMNHSNILPFFLLFSPVQPDEGAGPKVLKAPLRPLHCGNWVRNADGGSFSSPNYPNTYPPNKECLYVLEGRRLQAPTPSLLALNPALAPVSIT